jgi:hypothetical protein
MSHIRIEKDKAHHVVINLLRGRMSPKDVNEIAAQICDGLQAAMLMPTRSSLKGYRMIPSHPPHEIRPRLICGLSDVVLFPDEDVALTVWKTVYNFGRDLPDDVVI